MKIKMDENTNAHIDKLTNEIVDFVRYSFLYPNEMLKIIQSSYGDLGGIQSSEEEDERTD